ncbi:MAG: FMN-binding protein [Rhodocyclaceae bacterium]|nr:FMN-binding protein [Rhodocyclaceae bacterium]
MNEQTVHFMPRMDATPPARMVRVLALVAAICGSLVVAAHQGTLSAVQENKRIALERAVRKVLPEAREIIAYWLLPSGALAKANGAPPPGALVFHAGYDASGRLVGIAAEGAAKGYADTVRVLYAYDPHAQAVRGFAVIASRETPGIGDKVTKDKDFLANFPLSAQLSDDGTALAHEIRAVKHGTKTHPWEVDAIAGATITSRAVARAINEAAQALLPRLSPHLATLAQKT